MKPTPDDALGKLALAHLLGALEETEEALYTAYAADHPEAEAVLEEARKDLEHLAAPPVAAPESAWLKIQDQLRHKRAGSEPAQPLSPDDVILVSCSYCRDGLERGATVYCASCLAPHHGDCFREHGRCSVMGCGETQIVRATGHRDEPAEPTAPRRPNRWRRRAGWGLVVLASGAVAAYSGSDAFVAQVSGVPAEAPPPPREVAPPEVAPSEAPVRAEGDAQTLRVAWRGATLGEVLAKVYDAGVPHVSFDEEQLSLAAVADRDVFEVTAEELVQGLADELDLQVEWQAWEGGKRGYLEPASGARPEAAAPRRTYHGSYLVEGVEHARTTTVEVDSRPVVAQAVAEQSDVWAEIRGRRLRVYDTGVRVRDVPLSATGTPRGLVLSPDGKHVGWIQGKRVQLLDLTRPSANPSSILFSDEPARELEALRLVFGARGSLLVATRARWWVYAYRPGSEFGFQQVGAPHGVLSWQRAPRFARGEDVCFVARPRGGWWLIADESNRVSVYGVSIGEDGRWRDEGLLFQKPRTLGPGVEAEAVAQALRRRSLEDPFGETSTPSGLGAALAEARVERSAQAIAVSQFATATVTRAEGMTLEISSVGGVDRLELDPEEGASVLLAWQARDLLSLVQWGAHRVAIHTVRLGGPQANPRSRSARIERTLHAAVAGVQGVRLFRDGRFLLQLDTQARREGQVWVVPSHSDASPPQRRVVGSEVQFYSSRWAEPVEDAVRPTPRVARSVPSDGAYAKAREVVIGRVVLDYPSAGRVLRDVQPGAPNHAEAQQLYNYLLAHGLVHCEGLYSEGKADSALLLGRQLHELAEGTPIAANFAGKLALWETVYGAYQRGQASPEDSEQAEQAWSTILEAETHYGNYYAKRARRGLAAVEEARQAAEAARRPRPPAEAPPVATVDLRHVKPLQRWVFRRGGAEVEWEIRKVEGDTVTYRESAHLPGRENVQPPSLETWTPAALNLGQAQGGGVETRGPQRLGVEGVDLRYVVRKVGAVEHWVAVGRDGQPTFPGIVRDVRQGGSVAVELLRVE